MDNKTNTKNENTTIRQKIEVTLVVNLYKQATTGFLASIICSTIVLIYLYNSQSNIIVLSWYLFFIIVILFRYILVKAFNRDKTPEIHLPLWRNLFIVGTFFSGIGWGLTGTPLLLPFNNGLEQALLMMILAGICAGAVPLLAPIRSAALAFLIPALTPLIIHFLTIENPIYTLFNLAISVYLIYLVILSFKTHSIIHSSLQLQFENDVLLRNLSEAKIQLETANKRLQQAATHDPLTNIANRNLFELNFIDALSHAEHEKNILALFYLDLDNFKEVNDIYGHNAGDQLLLIVVARIKNILREKDIVSRLGGDELTVILEDINDLQTVADIAERICQAVSKPIKIDDAEVQVHSSIGISIYPIDGTDMETLLRVADRAMYYVKDHGGNSFHFNVQIEHT